jgi:hypothetical protein
MPPKVCFNLQFPSCWPQILSQDRLSARRDVEDHLPSFFMAGRNRSAQNTNTNYPKNLSQFLRKEFLGKFELEMKRLVA